MNKHTCIFGSKELSLVLSFFLYFRHLLIYKVHTHTIYVYLYRPPTAPALPLSLPPLPPPSLSPSHLLLLGRHAKRTAMEAEEEVEEKRRDLWAAALVSAARPLPKPVCSCHMK